METVTFSKDVEAARAANEKLWAMPEGQRAEAIEQWRMDYAAFAPFGRDVRLLELQDFYNWFLEDMRTAQIMVSEVFAQKLFETSGDMDAPDVKAEASKVYTVTALIHRLKGDKAACLDEDLHHAFEEWINGALLSVADTTPYRMMLDFNAHNLVLPLHWEASGFTVEELFEDV